MSEHLPDIRRAFKFNDRLGPLPLVEEVADTQAVEIRHFYHGTKTITLAGAQICESIDGAIKEEFKS